MITNSHVVTAAHCVHQKDELIKSTENIKIILGVHNLSDPYEVEKQFADVKYFAIHHDYEAKTLANLRFTGDLALITLDKKVTFTDYIRPICVFENINKKTEIPHKGIVAGWGQTLTTQKPHSEIPYAITIPIVDDGSCYRNDPRLAAIAWDKSFCAGYETIGACQGDSGSGFYIKLGDRYFLKGLVSSAVNNGGCSGNHLVIFTDLTKYKLPGML